MAKYSVGGAWPLTLSVLGQRQRPWSTSFWTRQNTQQDFTYHRMPDASRLPVGLSGTAGDFPYARQLDLGPPWGSLEVKPAGTLTGWPRTRSPSWQAKTWGLRWQGPKATCW